MNKIAKIALQVSFPGINVDSLIEVAFATRNPTASIEKLLGIFEEPKLKPYWQREDNIRVLKSFEWNREENDQVEYSYTTHDTIQGWYTPEIAAKIDYELDTDRAKARYTMQNAPKSKTEDENFSCFKSLIWENHYASSCSIETWKSHEKDTL